MSADEPSWDPPGPGRWYYAAEHLPGPVSTLFADLFPRVAAGWRRGTDRYGLPPNDGTFGPVGRFLYYAQVRAAPIDAAALAAAAEDSLARQRWRADLRHWASDTRPAVAAASRSLMQVDLAILDDPGLSDHLRRAVAHYLRWAPEHFALMAVQSTAGGALMEVARSWGLDTPELFEALAGSARSTASGDELLDRIAAGLHAAGRRDLESLDEVRALGGDAAAAMEELILDMGWRAFDRDLGATLAERPEALVASIRLALQQPGPRARPDPDRLAVLRDQVPDEDRDRFDDLVVVAREAYGFNDDNTVVLYSVPLGLIRRAVLEVGRRLVTSGRAHARDDAFEATTGELAELLAGAGPAADVLAQRTAERLAAVDLDPPAAVGVPPVPEPVDLPEPVQRLGRLTDAWWRAGSPREQDVESAAATVGDRAVRGRALVVTDPTEALLRLAPGDVLVALTTHATYNTIFPLVAAIAVQHGGRMGHAAVLARELGLTAIIGVPDLLDRVHDGDQVEVDPIAGTITVLSPATPT